MTLTGLVLIPILVTVIFMKWRYCLFTVIILLILPAASVVNIGSFGLQPSYFFALLLILRTFIEMTANRQPLDLFVLAKLFPLVIFMMLSLISLWCALVIFQNEVLVADSTAQMDITLAAPYTFTRGNLTQLLYLALNAATMYCLAHQATRMCPRQFAQTIDRAIIVTMIAAVAFIAWEILTQLFGFSFPWDFLHSNISFEHTSRTHIQPTFGFWRRSGSFSEPAHAAYFLSGGLFFALRRYRVRSDFQSFSLIVLLFVTSFVIRSSTAYLVILIFLIVLASGFPLRLMSGGVRRHLSLKTTFIIILLFVGVIFVALFAVNDWKSIQSALDLFLFSKTDSRSYELRASVDEMALQIAMETFGVGIGLGSHRANSLLLTLLSNVGVLGIVAMGAFFYDLLLPARRNDDPSMSSNYSSPWKWCILGLLIVHLISNPDFNAAPIWVISGLVLGSKAIAHRAEARFRRNSKPAATSSDVFGSISARNDL